METVMQTIEKFIGLHEELEVRYIVIGYEALLMGHDGNEILALAEGVTVSDALETLAMILDKTTPDDLRSKRLKKVREEAPTNSQSSVPASGVPR
jgi:hypothetical protein